MLFIEVSYCILAGILSEFRIHLDHGWPLNFVRVKTVSPDQDIKSYTLVYFWLWNYAFL